MPCTAATIRTFGDFQAAIQEVRRGLVDLSNADVDLATLMTLNFQQFEDVSLMAACRYNGEAAVDCDWPERSW